MKLIFQLIGFLMVIVILVTAILFYMDTKSLLSGDLANTIHTLRGLFDQARVVLGSFMGRSGIANDAADLLEDGANLIRKATNSPAATEAPTVIEIITPAP